MRVISKHNNEWMLTAGKTYHVISETENMYMMLDDRGNTNGFYKWRFDIVPEANSDVLTDIVSEIQSDLVKNKNINGLISLESKLQDIARAVHASAEKIQKTNVKIELQKEIQDLKEKLSKAEGGLKIILAQLGETNS